MNKNVIKATYNIQIRDKKVTNRSYRGRWKHSSVSVALFSVTFHFAVGGGRLDEPASPFFLSNYTFLWAEEM